MSSSEPSGVNRIPAAADKTVNDFFQNFRRAIADEASDDEPDYWKDDPKILLTTSDIGYVSIGTGRQIIEDIAQDIQSAQHEIIIVTCFWAKSASQEQLATTLKTLAYRARAKSRLVHVSICFSSCSLWQKLTHTSSLNGKVYMPETWPKMFGLPAAVELIENGEHGPIGVSLSVKSVFVKPLSIMHPKFIIIDRKQVFLPSCNISWETWFEGCIELRGAVVDKFFQFYQDFWSQDDSLKDFPGMTVDSNGYQKRHIGSASDLIHKSPFHASSIPTIFLPSPHHRNPQFHPTSLLSAPAPPPTPLNIFLLTIFESARSSIYIQTPNLTSPPVLTAVYDALTRGVNVEIVTSRYMMMIEQLLTAGTVTELCVRNLLHRYNALLRNHSTGRDPEANYKPPGRLSVRYFQPVPSGDLLDTGMEPVKSHLKLTVVDESIVVLGSGNMDRASWYTSQELGVAFLDQGLARHLRSVVRASLEGRLGEEQACEQ